MNNEYAFLARKHRQFEAVEDMNEAVRQHIYNNKSELTKSAISVLNLLAKYAVKFKGVAFLKFATIMEKTELSRSTVIRAVKLSVDLGIIGKQHVMRTKAVAMEQICMLSMIFNKMKLRLTPRKWNSVKIKKTQKKQTLKHCWRKPKLLTLKLILIKNM